VPGCSEHCLTMITSEALKVPSPMSSTPELLGLPSKVAKDLPTVGSCWLFALSLAKMSS
jgi:hypothetical protein